MSNTVTKIVIKGAREHNLKNISVEIPRDKLITITGLSGSGKFQGHSQVYRLIKLYLSCPP